MKKCFLALIAVTSTFALVSCGGGGGGATAGNTTNLPVSVVMSVGNQGNQVANYAAADLNGDGLEDVVVSGWNANISTAYVYIFIQNSDGTLSDRTPQLLANNVIEGSQRVLIADFDSDGKVDIFVPGFLDGNAITGAHSVMFWGSSGQYVKEVWTDLNSAHGACIADMNNDGKPDLLVAGSSYSGAVGGVYVNNGGRSFTRNSSVLPSEYFEACAAIKNASSNTIYFSGVNSVSGFRDAIVSFDFSLNVGTTLGMQNDNSLDTIDVVIADMNGDGQKDFILSMNGLNVNEAGPRKIVSSGGAAISTLESKRSAYHGRWLSDNIVFFSGDTNNASVYQGLTKYKPSSFTDMAGSSQGFMDAFVYQNGQGKIFMLELLNGTYKTREM
jgi:hypothetical protein